MNMTTWEARVYYDKPHNLWWVKHEPNEVPREGYIFFAEMGPRSDVIVPFLTNSERLTAMKLPKTEYRTLEVVEA